VVDEGLTRFILFIGPAARSSTTRLSSSCCTFLLGSGAGAAVPDRLVRRVAADADLIIHVIHTNGVPFLQSRASRRCCSPPASCWWCVAAFSPLAPPRLDACRALLALPGRDLLGYLVLKLVKTWPHRRLDLTPRFAGAAPTAPGLRCSFVRRAHEIDRPVAARILRWMAPDAIRP
jgi:hypothetical protein